MNFLLAPTVDSLRVNAKSPFNRM